MLEPVTLQSLFFLVGLRRPVASGIGLPKCLFFLTYSPEQLVKYLYIQSKRCQRAKIRQETAFNSIRSTFNGAAAGPDRRLVAMAKLLARRAAERDYHAFLDARDGEDSPC